MADKAAEAPTLRDSLSPEEAVLTYTQTMSRADRLELARALLDQNKQSTKCPELRRVLGRWIRRSRKERGVSQALLADHIGISRPAAASLEAGRQGCSLEQFVGICSALNQNPWQSLEEVLNWPTDESKERAQKGGAR